MSEFLLGLYIVAVGLTGNTGGLLSLVSTEAGFVPWIVAVAIGYYGWQDAPVPERKPVRLLIGTAVVGIVIMQRGKIVNGLTTAWTAISSLGSHGGLSSGAGGITGGGAASSQQAFLQSIYPSAQATANQLGVPVAAILGQTALETGFGTSNAYSNLNNVAGINVPGGNGSQYAGYASPSASLGALGSLVQSRYPQSTNTGVTGYFTGLQAGGYATDPLYAQKGISVANGPIVQGFLANIGQSSYP